MVGPKLSGPNHNFNSRRGVTLVEVLVSTLLLMLLCLAVSALQVAGHRFFLTAKDKATVGYEVQYAIEHIYEHILTGRSDDPTDPPIDLISSTEFTIKYIDKIDAAGPLKTCRYKIEGSELKFDSEDNGSFEESLGSQVDFIPGECAFTTNGKLFRIKLTAEFPLSRAGAPKQHLTLYSASYPRCASFQ